MNYLDELLENDRKETLAEDSFESIVWPIINFELWNRIFIDGNLRGYE